MATQKVLKLVKKIKGLTQYRNLPEDEIIAVAEEMIEKQNNKDKDLLDIEMYFDDKEEKKNASKLLKKYTDNYSIETVSDKNTIIQLIFLEILHFRFMKSANDSQKENGATPGSIVDSIHKNIKEIRDLKNQLGILKAKGSTDTVSALEVLRNKYTKWCEENQASRQFICPDCGQVTLLMIDISKYNASLHPHFKDRILFNEHLAKLYLEKKITDEDVAKVLNTSRYYTDWAIKKLWPTNIKFQEMESKLKSEEKAEGLEVEKIEVEAKTEITEEE